jgi:hypothetical protein
MTLKEKIGNVYVDKSISENLEKIADNYAIEFYLWMKDNEESIKNGKIITDKDLLKEFKKERNL